VKLIKTKSILGAYQYHQTHRHAQTQAEYIYETCQPVFEQTAHCDL
jgi:hypothetical protein